LKQWALERLLKDGTTNTSSATLNPYSLNGNARLLKRSTHLTG
jgi:hypothetical protein